MPPASTGKLINSGRHERPRQRIYIRLVGGTRAPVGENKARRSAPGDRRGATWTTVNRRPHTTRRCFLWLPAILRLCSGVSLSLRAQFARPADDPCTASGNVERDPSGAVSGVRKTGRRRQGSQPKQRQCDFKERRGLTVPEKIY